MQCQKVLESREGMPHRDINSNILFVILYPKTMCNVGLFSVENGPTLNVVCGYTIDLGQAVENSSPKVSKNTFFFTSNSIVVVHYYPI